MNDTDPGKDEKGGGLHPQSPHADNFLTDTERDLLNCIQNNFPLQSRPYKALGKRVGISERSCMEILRDLTKKGIVRSIRAVLSWRNIGFSTILIGIKVKPESIDEIAQELNATEGVTHNYSREGDFNLWCTLIYSETTEKDTLIERIDQMDGVEDVREFAAEKTYKIGLKLNV